MKRTVVWIVVLVSSLLLAVIVSLPWLIDANQFRPLLESRLSGVVGRPVTIGNLGLSLWAGGVTAADLAVADAPAFSREPFLTARKLDIKVDLKTLIFSRRLHVTGLAIEQPSITLLQSPQGDWNYASLGATAARSAPPPPSSPGNNLDLSVKLLKISQGRVSIGKVGSRAKPLTLEKVTAEVRDFSASAAFPFAIAAEVAGGGKIDLNGRAGPIAAGDTSATPVSASFRIDGLNLAAPGVVEAAGIVAGLVSLEGTGNTDGKTLRVEGRLKGERLKLARQGKPASQPLTFAFAASHDVGKRAGRLSKGDIRIGKAAAALTGGWTARAESTVWNLNLAGPDMPVPDLAAMLPSLGIVLPNGSSLQGGTALVRLSMEGPLDHLVTAGTIGLDKTRLAGFDLGARMRAIESLAGIKQGPDTEVETLRMNLRMAPEGTSADDIRLIVPSVGELSGAGTVSPAQVLAFHMQARIHTSGAVMAALGQKGDTNVPFTVEGTAADPVFRPDVKAIAGQKIQHLEQKAVEKAAGGLLKGLFGKKEK